MIFQLRDVDRHSASQLPEACRACGWWQGHDNGWLSDREASDWAQTAEEACGSWGKLALADEQLLAAIQFGPAHLFPRAGKLPCGPVSNGAVLLTCCAVAPDALKSVQKSLLTAFLVELKRQRVETIEAFGTEAAEGQDACRFFSADFLRDCGFFPVRSARNLRLMRFELGGVQPVMQLKEQRRGILQRIKGRSAAPAPAAMSGVLLDCSSARCNKCLPATACFRDG